MKGKREGRKPKASGGTSEGGLKFTGKNYWLLALGIVAIAIGYQQLAQGSITLAPILLILGYCVIIPIAIIIK
jgi:hypothetical protein